MSVSSRFDAAVSAVDEQNLGERMFKLASRLYPICRSITGDGVRTTLKILGEEMDLELHEVPTGYQAFDWTVPREWRITDAYVKDPRGRP